MTQLQLPGMGITRARIHLENLRQAAAYFAERGYGTEEILRLPDSMLTDTLLAELDASTGDSLHSFESRNAQLNDEEAAAIAEAFNQGRIAGKPPRFAE